MSQPTSGYLYARNIVNVKDSSTVSASAQTTGVDVTQFGSNGVTLIFSCSAVAGGGSLSIAVEASDTLGSGYVAVTGAVKVVAAAGVSLLFVPNFQGKFLRLNMTLTGTSVTFSALVYGDPGAATTNEIYSTSPAS